ncbi:MAG: hypothetical protein RL417_789, partial [Pseudomonadota bacterium]
MKMSAFSVVRALVICGWCLGVGAPGVSAEGPLKVTSFSPNGVARDVRQVQVVFSENVVPFSDGVSSLQPFEVSCGEHGKSRWLDERTWLYEFPQDLPSGLRCRFVLNPGLTALSGAKPTSPEEFRFSTGGPVILSATPYEGAELEEEPYFQLSLSGPVDARSVEEHVSFVNAGIESPIGVEIVTGALAEEILNQNNDATPPERRLIIKPKLRLAPKTKVNLVW